MAIEPINLEDQLFLKLRTATVQRLRAAHRADHGLCVLLERERVACLHELGAHRAAAHRHILSAA
ncbi:MAG: hypothetical protein IPG43_00600 [Proteobacteria bacterium]|nr:hypothetical protein [Pseudomonadota bacterium]